jgi:hypothetical protein
MLRLFALLCALLPVPALADDITPDSFANRINNGSLKLAIANVQVKEGHLYIQGVPMGDAVPLAARLSYAIENNSGIPLGMALKMSGISAGPCHEVQEASGLEMYNDGLILQLQHNKSYRDRSMRLVPSGSRVSGTVEFDKTECRASDMEGMTTVPVTVSVVIANGDNFLLVPLTADGRLYIQSR